MTGKCIPLLRPVYLNVSLKGYILMPNIKALSSQAGAIEETVILLALGCSRCYGLPQPHQYA